jgi:hypothetical protein
MSLGKTGSGIPPWHLWGGSQTITATDPGGAPSIATKGQLAKISYARPDSWHWLFFAQVVDQPGVALVDPQTISLNLTWNLTLGVGRTNTIIAGFEVFQFLWTQAGGTNPVNGTRKWSTEALGFPRNDSFPPPDVLGDGRTLWNPINQVVAQDIQLEVAATLISPVAASVSVIVQALFAPKTHLRPEWHMGFFPGGEAG